MKNRSIGIKLVLFLALAALALFAMPNIAAAQESGNVCVADYGGNSCTANDVRFESLTPILTVEGCNEGTVGETTVVFEAVVASDGSPDRYDIGLYFALDGGSAYDGDSCYHDYLEGPLTTTPNYSLDLLPIGSAPDGTLDSIDHTPPTEDPFYSDPGDFADGDTCGDNEQNRAFLKQIAPISIACVDNDNDGAADISVCTSWKNNPATGGVCTDVTGAIPGTPSKCSCEIINFGFTPNAITLSNASTSPSNSIALILSALSIVAMVTLFVVARRSTKLTV